MRRCGAVVIALGLVVSYFAFGDVKKIDPRNQAGLMARLSAIPQKYVLIQVWSPFCSGCGKEVSELNAIRPMAKSTPRSVEVLGIPVQSRQREIDAFLEHFKPEYDQWYPDESFKKSVSGGALTLPWLMLFDKTKGIIIKEWHGSVTANELMEAVMDAR
ncbi:MAG: hypothetical protein AABZ06_00140 [Bdellovibrionota bacterium]